MKGDTANNSGRTVNACQHFKYNRGHRIMGGPRRHWKQEGPNRGRRSSSPRQYKHQSSISAPPTVGGGECPGTRHHVRENTSSF